MCPKSGSTPRYAAIKSRFFQITFLTNIQLLILGKTIQFLILFPVMTERGEGGQRIGDLLPIKSFFTPLLDGYRCKSKLDHV